MKWLGAVMIFLAVVGWHAQAHAACSTHTYFLADGRMLLCTTCCTGSHCTTSCI